MRQIRGGHAVFDVDVSQIVALGEVYERAGKDGPKIVAAAMNQRGNVAFTQVARATAKETGLPVGQTKQHMRKVKAQPRDLVFTIRAWGKNLSLKNFGARQVRKGVSHKGWGRRQVAKGAFIIEKYDGEVYRRISKKRRPITKLYGPSIPDEMVKGESYPAMLRAFDGLADRLMHELGRRLGRK
ncbi:hypothetical protein [Amorphus sp. 3PC139-8]|uniref:hypothetical protein n=1 Tax=Amorphus sp. 3PC139-8 TaxID=2735676 RepID=UPI00345CDAD8